MQNVNLTVVESKFIAELLPLGMTVEQATVLQDTAIARDVLRKQVAVLEATYRTHLPFATQSQIDAVCYAAKTETELADGDKPNVDFVLTDAQQARLVLAKEERKAELATRKDEIMIPLQENDEEKLTSYKVRVGKAKTTTSLRFERQHASGPKAGLLAAIAAAARK